MVVNLAPEPPSSLSVTARGAEGSRQDLPHCCRGSHSSVGGHREGRVLTSAWESFPRISWFSKRTRRGAKSSSTGADTSCLPPPSCDVPRTSATSPSRNPWALQLHPEDQVKRWCYSLQQTTRPSNKGKNLRPRAVLQVLGTLSGYSPPFACL